MHHVLIVDDNPLQRKLIESVVAGQMHYDVTMVEGGQEAIDLIQSDDRKRISLVLLDLSMPKVTGMDVLKAVHPIRPELPIIIVTAHGDVNVAVEAMRLGAVDFVQKDEDPEKLKISIFNALRLNALNVEVSRLKRAQSGMVEFADIVARSEVMKKTIAAAEKAAESNIPILIKGQSGVGKELFARAIHGSSARAGKPFIAVNCGAIPENLVESTLFGHEKGSFTGAINKSIGKFREADGGTLFLDEVSELRLDLQVKLLRALQAGEVEPVGAGRPVKIDVRFISATNRSLKEAIAKGQFREDLYYRLNVFPLTIPPLSQRPEDVPLLLEYFVKTIAATERKNISGLSADAIAALSRYHWPGNVRQLENAVFRAVVLSEKDVLGADDFAHILKANFEDAMLQTSSSTSSPSVSAGFVGSDGNFKKLTTIEAEAIRAALEHFSGQISDAAKALGISRSTFYRKMEEYQIREEKQTNVS